MGSRPSALRRRGWWPSGSSASCWHWLVFVPAPWIAWWGGGSRGLSCRLLQLRRRRRSGHRGVVTTHATRSGSWWSPQPGSPCSEGGGFWRCACGPRIGGSKAGEWCSPLLRRGHQSGLEGSSTRRPCSATPSSSRGQRPPAAIPSRPTRARAQQVAGRRSQWVASAQWTYGPKWRAGGGTLPSGLAVSRHNRWTPLLGARGGGYMTCSVTSYTWQRPRT